MVSEYIGNVTPFYISRHRLQLLSDRITPTWKGSFTGKLTIPGAGEIGFSHQGHDKGTIVRLERILSWLSGKGAIGDVWNADCSYTWIHVRSHIAWITNVPEGVDHLVVADDHSLTPTDWRTFLAGLRTNLISLEPPDKYPQLGSSPLALQGVLREVHAADKKPGTRTSAVGRDGTCERLRDACHSLSGEQPQWEIAGVAEIVYRCTDHRVLLSSPLFLSSFA